MNTRTRRTLIFLSFGLFLAYGCKTTNTKVDKYNRHLSVYSTGDSRTAMTKPEEDPVVKNAKSSLEAFVKATPNDEKSWINLANIYLSEGNLVESEKACRKALRVNIRSREAKIILAQIALRSENLELASILVNGLDDTKIKDTQILNLQALIEMKKNNPSEAMALWKQSLIIDPENISARMNLGVLNLKYRQLSAAATHFERVLALMPNHGDANLHLGIVKTAQGDLNNARKIFEKILSISPNNSIALFNLAVLEQKEKNYDDAVDHLRLFLKTSTARNNRTEQALALMEEINDLRERENNNKASDREIRGLAQEMENNPDSKAEFKSVRTAAGDVDQNAEQESPTLAEPEIDDLEKQILK